MRNPSIVLTNLFGKFGLTWAFLLTACASSPTPATTFPPLTPYQTRTPSPTPTLALISPSQSEIVSTPTPVTYIVQPGDTLSAIALRFGVSLEALMAANPTVSPNLLPIGATLIIPTDPNHPAGLIPPTPVPFSVLQASCYPIPEGGLWCLALVKNDGPTALENVEVRLILISTDGMPLTDQTAILPFNRLAPGVALPLAAFFPPPIPADVRLQVQPVAAISLSPEESPFLEATLIDLKTEPSADGRMVRVSGQVILPSAAQTVWVIAVAYDAHGQVIGFRRWEQDQPSPAGTLPFALQVIGFRPIDRVEILVEARP